MHTRLLKVTDYMHLTKMVMADYHNNTYTMYYNVT